MKKIAFALIAITTIWYINNTKINELNAFESEMYQCDGRKYCSQMTSCEEATFFINNCPNTKMDGDNDGVPCESQWCGYK